METGNTFGYKSGKPINTGAVVNYKLDYGNIAENGIFKVTETKENIELSLSLKNTDKVFGLGEMMGSLNKRGKKYTLYATDDPNHTPQKESLYSSHPFIILDGKDKLGIFIDYPGEIVFDIGFGDKNVLKITVMSKDFDFYIFDTPKPLDIIKHYLELTGKPYVPPKWAFGYQQCRWSYPDAKRVNEIAESFKKHDIPCDAIYLDIDYMENYKVFTVDDVKFPEFKKMTAKLKEQGIKTITIIDPGVKIEEGYDVYLEGVEKGFFCKKENGEYFTPAVWPGLTHFPDFMNAESREWWGKLYKRLYDLGVDGFWNDMNEPSIFYTKEAMENIGAEFKKIEGRNLGLDMMGIAHKMGNMANKREYYKEFYHRTDDGEMINHDKVHNLYGYGMNKATADEVVKYNGNKRYFLLSRSSYSGMHRFSAIWTGDNASWWEHLILHIKMLQSLNMAGFFYTGADVGGFGSDVSSEMITRWMQIGMFTPLFRNHAAMGTRNQEPWEFDHETNMNLRNIIRMRYALMPYYYSEFMQSVSKNSPFISPLFLYFDEETAKETEDQFMVGENMMAAPVYTQNTTGRHVYLPESKWLKWNICSYEEREYTVFDAGHHYIKAGLNEVPVFIKENSLIVIKEPENYIGEKKCKGLEVIAFVTKSAEYMLYDDDGETFKYENGEKSLLEIKIEKHGPEYRCSAVRKGSAFDEIEQIVFTVVNSENEVKKYVTS